MARDPLCQCEPCQKRREQARQWFARNREKRLKQNAANKRKRKRVPKIELSDEDLDRRALQSMPWRNA